jgi:hypothetical protein
MVINLNVKIKGGPRTPVEVDVYGTSVNDKVLKFKNGTTVKERHLAEWIERNLLKSLQDAQNAT